MKNTVCLLSLIICFLSIDSFAAPKREKPIYINQDALSHTYIAPVSQGKIFQMPFQHIIQVPDQNAIRRYELRIFNNQGIAVAIFYDGQEVQNISGRTKWIGELPITPPHLSWDGTYNLDTDIRNGSPVPDGNYVYHIAVIDINGTEIKSSPVGITVDNTAPKYSHLLQYSNNMPKIQQKSSPEMKWSVSIINDHNQPVYEQIFENKETIYNDITLPGEFVWDGKNGNDQIQPDGEYRYIVVGEDRAGNTSRAQVPLQFRMNEESNILASETARTSTENGMFSFNYNSAVEDKIRVHVASDEDTSITGWEMSVASTSDPQNTFLSLEGGSSVNLNYDFDDLSTQQLPHDDYDIHLRLLGEEEEHVTERLRIRMNESGIAILPGTGAATSDTPEPLKASVTPQKLASKAPYSYSSLRTQGLDCNRHNMVHSSDMLRGSDIRSQNIMASPECTGISPKDMINITQINEDRYLQLINDPSTYFAVSAYGQYKKPGKYAFFHANRGGKNFVTVVARSQGYDKYRESASILLTNAAGLVTGRN